MIAVPPRAGEPASRLGGIGLMVGGVALCGTMDAVAKLLVVADYPVLQVVWGRYVFHMALVALLVAGQGRLASVRSRRLGLQLGRSACLAISTIAIFAAYAHLALADAQAIAQATPLFLTALSALLLGERVGWRRWSAVAVGLLGVLVIIRPGLGVMHWAAGLVVVASLFGALYLVGTRRVGSADPPATSLFYTALFGAVGLSAAMPFVWVAPDLAGWAGLAGVGLLGGAGHLLMIRAFQRLPASVLSPFQYGNLLCAVVFGLLLFGEFPDGWTMLGAAIVVGSGLFVIWRETRATAAPSLPARP